MAYPVGRHHRHVVDVFRGRRADGAVSVRGRRRARARPDQQLCVGDIPGMGAQRRQRRPAAVGLEGAVPPVRALDAVRDGPDQRGYPRLRAVPVSGHRQYHPRRAAGRGRGRGGLRDAFPRGGVQRRDGRHRHGGPEALGRGYRVDVLLYQRGYPLRVLCGRGYRKDPHGRAVAVRGDGDHRQGIEIIRQAQPGFDHQQAHAGHRGLHPQRA